VLEKINPAYSRINNEIRRQLNGQPNKEELRSLRSELLRVFGNAAITDPKPDRRSHGHIRGLNNA
jgi:hypothetical protein